MSVIVLSFAVSFSFRPTMVVTSFPKSVGKRSMEKSSYIISSFFAVLQAAMFVMFCEVSPVSLLCSSME